MFLLNEVKINKEITIFKFTIQNVSIKSNPGFVFLPTFQDLQYKMFLLNS